MARAFDGVDDYLALSAGGISALDGGPITVAVVVKLANHDVGGIVTTRPLAGGYTWALAVSAGDWYFAAGDIMNVFAASTADGWTLIAVTKATGTVTPRGHKYVYSTNTWTHANGAGTVSDAGAGVGSDGAVEIGRWDNYGEYATADIAVAGVWGRVLTDAEVEHLAHTLTSWYAAAPAGLWLLDQSATTQNVVDVTGGGANQTALTGTMVAAGSALIGYGHDVLVPHSIPAAGGTTYDADAALTATATLAATATADRAAQAAAPITATVASTATVDRPVNAALTVATATTATAAVDLTSGAALAATATTVATATADRAADATHAITATLTATAVVDRSVDSALAVTAGRTAAAALDLPVSAVAETTAALTTTATVDRAAAVALTVTTAATATAVLDLPAAASLTTTAAIAATATLDIASAAARTVTASITTTVTVTTPGAALTVTVDPPTTGWYAATADTGWRADPPSTGWTATAPRR